MCDQTEVPYLAGDVVWVKLGPVWWPASVCNNDDVPAEILKNLRKTPIAIVKFFQEEQYEYVQKLTNIYHYNCLKKNDFIRKGLDMYRNKNRDAPSNMKLFPEDVVHAEVLTGGNADILRDKTFEPEEKTSYTEFFPALKKTIKKPKMEAAVKKRTSGSIRVGSPSKHNVVSPRIITHPRFLALSNGRSTDYEVRERKQDPRRSTEIMDDDPPSTQNIFQCRDCNFSTARLNVIILHNKSHNQPQLSALVKRKHVPTGHDRAKDVAKLKNNDQESSPTKIPKSTTVTKISGRRGRPPKKLLDSELPVLGQTVVREIMSPPSVSPSPKSTPTKKSDADSFHKSLLEDWEDEDDLEDNAVGIPKIAVGDSGLTLAKKEVKSYLEFENDENEPRTIEMLARKSQDQNGIECVFEMETTNIESNGKSEENVNSTDIVENVNKNTPNEDSKDDALKKEVDILLHQISAPSKLPEMPRSLKKEQIKIYNASLVESQHLQPILNNQSEDSISSQSCNDKTEENKLVNNEEELHTSLLRQEIPRTTPPQLEVSLKNEPTPVISEETNLKPDAGYPDQKTELATASEISPTAKSKRIALSGFRLIQSPNTNTQEIVDKIKSLGVKISTSPATTNKPTLVLVKSNTVTSSGSKQVILRAVKSPGHTPDKLIQQQKLVIKSSTKEQYPNSHSSTMVTSTAEATLPSAVYDTVENGKETGQRKDDILAQALLHSDMMELTADLSPSLSDPIGISQVITAPLDSSRIDVKDNVLMTGSLVSL